MYSSSSSAAAASNYLSYVGLYLHLAAAFGTCQSRTVSPSQLSVVFPSFQMSSPPRQSTSRGRTLCLDTGP
ncbi:hypothetical protein HYQ45_004523 [Verticillium longisporum]|uniref:Uncharacterized protein n=1 Tax=Verticillium longisporum TaxID=100787 RepID=A0A8I3AXV1_VERLO|nr:hypothetical protein HYQ45_004523 [Verticillium longisporum]